MLTAKYRQRLKALFADFEAIDSRASAVSEDGQGESKTARTRLKQEDAGGKNGRKRQAAKPKAVRRKTAPAKAAKTAKVAKGPVETPAEAPAQAAPASPLLYEMEKLGYAYRGNRLVKLQKGTSPTTEDEPVLHAPLSTGGQVIGDLKIEPSSERPLTPEDENLAEAIARQVSQQIQNLRLLSATERARTDAEASTRRFIHESWDAFLDAIQRDERIGYSYDQTGVAPCTDPPPDNPGFQEAVDVLGEQVGTVYLEPNPDRPLTDVDRALMRAVATQISQQVENIRLVADASRARAAAEDATRLLTRDNWQAYIAQANEAALGFLYDTIRVRPLDEADLAQEIVLSQPLTVRGETIGQLAVAGLEKVPPQAAELAASIASQASIHLETLRLTEELRKRAAELQELDRLKTAFLANMSHELRTPLNSILGFADVMIEGLDGPLTTNMDNDLRLIQKNGKHLLSLINDVLDMAKIEAGRMNLVAEKFVLHDILEEITSIASPLASEKSISLFIEPGSDRDLQVTADRTRLRQVMLNLVNNSIKFTEQGEIAISARQDDDKVLIRVKDTGIGIPQEQLEVIFQEFVQVDTSTTRKAGGTGLGLPISRRLIEIHGGRLWAESTGVDGEGSSLFVLLPLEARIKEETQEVGK